MKIDRNEIIRLTEEYGGAWGINHTRRLLQLIAIIGDGRSYNTEALWLAAHLHDWGAYLPWVKKDVDHVVRSLQVAERFLAERDCPAEQQALILECIKHHHSPESDFSLEAILLRDADALDFLGVVGILRNFSKNPREMRKAYEETIRRRNKMLAILSLDKARALAAVRVKQMDSLLEEFEAETFDCF